MSPSLPEFWAKSKLDEISFSVSTSGKKVKTQDALPTGKYKVIDQSASESPGFLNDEARVIQATKDNPVILFGDHTRAVKYIDHDFIPGADGTKLLRAKAGIDPRYLRYLVESADIPDRGYSRHFQYLNAAELPVAPAAEQTRVANQLDALLARVQACNDRFDAIPALLKRFRQTVLDAAASGRLTEDWRGRDDLKPGEWETVVLQDVIAEMRNGLAQKPTESPPGSKILRIGAVRSGQLNLDDHRYLVVSDKESEQYALKQHDILFTRYNGSLEFVGVCAALTHDAPGYVYPDKLIRVRVRADRALAKFIEIVFGCHIMRTQVESFVKSSAGQRGVSGADLKAAKFSLPPITEQTEIVRRVEALFALSDRIETRYAAARTQAQRLSPLVLAKAFRGELVRQDSSDEPASALLARITEQRATLAEKIQTKKPRQSSTPRATKEATAMTKSRQDEDVKDKPYLADHLRRLGSATTAEVLFKASDLPVADFYKQLAWEVAEGHIADGGNTLEARHAIG